MPKRELASTLQAVLQTDRMAIARDLPFSRVLEDELSNFRVKLSVGGNETFEGRSGVHDDLVLSLAIAVWAAEKRDHGPGIALLHIARQQLDEYHQTNGGRPQPITRCRSEISPATRSDVPFHKRVFQGPSIQILAPLRTY